MDESLTRARERFTAGIAAFEAGRLDEAAALFEETLALAPGRPSVLANLGITRVRLGQPAVALPLLVQATATAPDDLSAWFHLALAHGAVGDLPAALLVWDRVTQLAPGMAAAWEHRGTVLRELGRLSEAATSFRRALELGADPTVIGYYLAGVVGGPAPPAAPREYVAQLFDDYAADFGPHLVQALRYQAHERLIAALPAPGCWTAALDLGCGTGLVGALLRPRARRLTGIDLSARMVERARASGHYDRVQQADLLPWLEQTDERFDLVVAADVFIYVGALDAVLAGVRRVLNAGGLLAFSVEVPAPDEVGDGSGLVLRPSLRYAHADAYLRPLARQHGFAVLRADDGPLREEQRRPVAGRYWVLQAPGD